MPFFYSPCRHLTITITRHRERDK